MQRKPEGTEVEAALNLYAPLKERVTKSIYLAGKIGKNDWRHSIVQGLRGTDVNDVKEWPVLRNAIFERFDYTGPYFIGCDHGCYHGPGTHGCGVRGKGCLSSLQSGPGLIARHCVDAIDQSDLVFAWIDSLDAYGTLFELGWAAAKNKDIILALPNEEQFREMWLTVTAVDNMQIATTPREALQRVLAPKGTAFDSPLEQDFWMKWQTVVGNSISLEPQYKIGRYRIDFAHVPTKTAVELDGFTYHNQPDRFQYDRERDRTLAEQGWMTVRFASNELRNDLERCIIQTCGLIMKRRNSIGKNFDTLDH